MSVIRAKDLRRDLARILARARRGERFTVLYRSEPLCEIVPLGAPPTELPALEHEPLYRAKAVGRSEGGKRKVDPDEILYGWRRR
jgi:antitoxin (DNA-binding transcriptional repressor) of toxin-antitoxin stability system